MRLRWSVLATASVGPASAYGGGGSADNAVFAAGGIGAAKEHHG